MEQTLVIAEKPSVAQSIATVLGARKKMRGCFVGSSYIVSWCIGHLVELASPDRYDPRYKTWRKADLPIIPAPEHWQYEVIAKTHEQFDVLKSYMTAPNVSEIICATDAGREGELIFRLVYAAAGSTKPVKRLWISSLEESTIRDGFAHLQDSADFDPLYQAALCRAQADWLVGINASRLYSILYDQPLNVGRVLTPTLALLTAREQTIREFTPTPFYTVQLSCGFLAKSQRIESKTEAEAIRDTCHLKTAVVQSVERTSHTINPPHLYDLTSLQRDANRLHGFTARQTLDYAQSLYEHRLTTYPRTSSCFLPSDALASLPALLQQTIKLLPNLGMTELPTHAEQVIDDGQITDHHAIIPTRSATLGQLQELPAGERCIFDLIATRLVCALGEPARYDQTVVTLSCEDHIFTATGRTATNMGWQAICKPAKAESENPLPILEEGHRLSPVMASLHESQTTAPAPYTEDTLLAAMEQTGKSLGTPATRAGIIEKLITAGMAERTGSGKTKNLVPTEKGMILIHILPEALSSPLLTAEWEQRLLAIERGEADPKTFMADIERMLHDLVDSARRTPDGASVLPSPFPQIALCPSCGSPVVAKQKGAFCTIDACRFGLWWNRRFFAEKHLPVTPALVQELIQHGSVHCDELWSGKTGRTYAATIHMSVEPDGNPSFQLTFDNERNHQ